MSDNRDPKLVAITPESLQEVLSKAIEAAVKAAKEPDEATKARIAKEAEEAEKRQAQMIELAKAEEESRKVKWANCSHKKENGKPCVGGQIHSDGLVHLFCLRCQYPFPPFKPTQDMLATGI